MNTATSDIDRRHLARALELARQGRGQVSPNPLVGAVVARGEEVLGEGYHHALGRPHAEVEALAAADGADLTDATLYVSLEPCCHHGRTPPCTDAILAAGLRRVVVGSDDPSEKASGRGLGILRDEGIDVLVADAELARRARLLNQPFRKYARVQRPWVLFKSAMTLDGRVATDSGDSKWISGAASRRRAHEWRAELDAVAVGIGTALADDPQLTARTEHARRQPLRVVFDSLGRLRLDSQLVRAAPEVPLLVVVSRAAPRATVSALQAAGADVLVAAGANEPARVVSALDQFAQREISSILLEGGPRLAGVFFDAGEIDELRLFLAPLVLGGRGARSPLEGEGAQAIADALPALSMDIERVDGDVLVTARLREW